MTTNDWRSPLIVSLPSNPSGSKAEKLLGLGLEVTPILSTGFYGDNSLLVRASWSLAGLVCPSSRLTPLLPLLHFFS